MNRLNRLSSPHVGAVFDENTKMVWTAPVIAPLVVVAIRCPQRFTQPHGNKEKVWYVGPEYWNGYREEEECHSSD